MQDWSLIALIYIVFFSMTLIYAGKSARRSFKNTYILNNYRTFKGLNSLYALCVEGMLKQSLNAFQLIQQSIQHI